MLKLFFLISIAIILAIFITRLFINGIVQTFKNNSEIEKIFKPPIIYLIGVVFLIIFKLIFTILLFIFI